MEEEYSDDFYLSTLTNAVQDLGMTVFKYYTDGQPSNAVDQNEKKWLLNYKSFTLCNLTFHYCINLSDILYEEYFFYVIIIRFFYILNLELNTAMCILSM